MIESLQDVIAAAVESAETSKPADGATRRAPLLRAVQMPPLTAVRSEPAPLAALSGGNSTNLGRNGLRLAFWLCGFHETLRERQSRGETLDQREASLVALSTKDFDAIRPIVIGMAIEQLKAAICQFGPRDAAPSGHVPGEMEAFALESIGSLSTRASALLRDGGPDTALSLFGGDSSVQEPLAIFQLVFSTTVSLAEAFHCLVPGDAWTLKALIETLGSEVERI